MNKIELGHGEKRICNRCGNEVEKSVIQAYSYSCNDCDEDLYEFETRIYEGIEQHG